jgi:hypothetical protein
MVPLPPTDNLYKRALAALFDPPGGEIIAVDPARKVRKMHEG